MATRSTIRIERKDGTQTSIYCHWDGYVEHNGAILQMYYNTPEKIEKLLAIGDISSLREKVEPDPNKEHNFENPQEDVCVAYSRDRGEEFRQSYGREDYNYVFDEWNGVWWVEEEIFVEKTPRMERWGLYAFETRKRLLMDAIEESLEHINDYLDKGWEMADFSKKAREAREAINR